MRCYMYVQLARTTTPSGRTGQSNQPRLLTGTAGGQVDSKRARERREGAESTGGEVAENEQT